MNSDCATEHVLACWKEHSFNVAPDSPDPKTETIEPFARFGLKLAALTTAVILSDCAKRPGVKKSSARQGMTIVFKVSFIHKN